MRQGDGYSLERRLLVRLLVVLAIIGLGLVLVADAYARRAADEAYDRLLLAAGLSVADAVRSEGDEITIDLPYAALAILAMAPRDRVFYRVSAPGGQLITGYEDLPAVAGPAAGEPRFADMSYRNTMVRVATLSRFVARPSGGDWVAIVVGQTREERNALAREILANIFVPVALTIMAGAALLWFGIRKALVPLNLLEGVIRDKRPTDLSPIKAPAPKEVQRLVQALNRLMGWLATNLEAMQTFLADAAHQIRTPLATLRALADLAMEEDDVATLRSYVHKIHRNAALASQVTNQLLSHALVIYRGQLAPREKVDLASLLRQVAHRAEMGGSGPPIELDFRGLKDPAIIEGDPITLREAFTNLLDNARKYAGDQHPVQIRIASTGDRRRRIEVEIADQGPGIPDIDKGRMLERFARGSGGQQVTGSGLGLAIVQAVATAHDAMLALLDRPGGGLVVRLSFPLGPTAASALIAPTMQARSLALLFALLLAAKVAAAGEARIYPAIDTESVRLHIHGATDLAAIEPLIQDFQSFHPQVTVAYLDLNSNELYERVLREADDPADLVISSAIDLQVKLANDGYARAHRSTATRVLPAWANWRDEVFGFTLEPAVIVYNRDLVAPSEVPRSHNGLVQLLREQEARYRHRVATYDIAESGVGYLFAAYDSIYASQFWPLVLALGSVRARLACCTGEILDLIERGEVLIGYNLLGAYARARALAGAPIGIVQPEDYTLVMSRAALIPRLARQPDLGGMFIDYLVSTRGQETIARRALLYPLNALAYKAIEATGQGQLLAGPLRPLALGPALLVFLDPMKRARFIASWQQVVLQP